MMRARYAAYALGEQDYLFRSWHPRTRPDDLEPSPGMTWTGLDVLDTVAGGPDDQEGEVAFVAHYRTAGGAGELRERSRFTRRAGRWVYVDGDAQVPLR
nr:YchJ family metal-binding protein [Nocardioides luti]